AQCDVFACEHEPDQGLPEIAVRHSFALRIGPGALEPPLVPLVAKTVHDVRAIAHDLDRARVRLDGFEHCRELHALVRGVRISTARKRPIFNRPSPAAGSRVSAAGPVGINGDHQRDSLSRASWISRASSAPFSSLLGFQTMPRPSSAFGLGMMWKWTWKTA